jgi:predicted acylesterase/phospholipase RssA
MGSLVGAAYATGRSYADMVRLAGQLFDPRQLFDYTLPLVALMATDKITKLIRQQFAELQIEDLWLPYFCVSANLSRAELVVHQTGPLWEGVRASIAIPGVFAPLLRDGDVLFDGGLINYFPADIVRRLCETGPVIGVYIPHPEAKAKAYEFGPSVSGWQVLWRRINPFVEPMRVPSLADSLVRCLRVTGAQQFESMQRYVDMLIEPDVRKVGMLDFASYSSIIDAGYQAAREPLARWLEQRQAEPGA